MNKIGFNLLVWSAVVSDEMLPIVDRLRSIGYDGVECSMGSQDPAAYRRLGDHARQLGLEVNCCLAVGADENPVSESQAVRAKALDRIKWAIERASDMESKVVCGPFHSAFATFSHRPPEVDEYKRSAEILNMAAEFAAQADVTLSLEALNRFECYLCNTMDQLIYLLSMVDHRSVTAMYDTHHANIEEKNLPEAINKVSPYLSHVHISENDRGTPGEGHIPWDDTFDTLARCNYRGWLTIEAFTRSDPEFANAINVWREYSEPWAMAEQGLAFIQRMCQKYGM